VEDVIQNTLTAAGRLTCSGHDALYIRFEAQEAGNRREGFCKEGGVTVRGRAARGRNNNASLMRELTGEEALSGTEKNMLQRSTAALATGRMNKGSGAQRFVNHKLPPTAQPGSPARAHCRMAMPKKMNAGMVTAVAKKHRHGGQRAAFHACRVCFNSCAYAAPLSSRGRAPTAVKRCDSTGMMNEAKRLEARTWSRTRGRRAERKAKATAAMAHVSGRPRAARESVQAAMSTARPVRPGGGLAAAAVVQRELKERQFDAENG
jgi:hypothetical protein